MMKAWLQSVKAFISGWLVGLGLWLILRRTGFQAYLDFFEAEFSVSNITLLLLLMSLVAGVVFGTIEFTFEKYATKKISFNRLLIRAICIHMGVMLILYLGVYVFLRLLGLDADYLFREFIVSSILLVNLLYTILINIVIVLVIHLNKVLGKGYLWKLLTGKFYAPKEEQRVFMFLDLQSSTSIAETLGHVKYSQFIQDCFYDLQAIEHLEAEVYQYVGDEVVLTWLVEDKEVFKNGLETYFTFEEAIMKKSTYYQERYNVVPHFRAGMHVGLITAVEVGKLKREIAYHGDTINTASRIQEQCKVYQEDFLISGVFKENFGENNLFTFEKVGKEILRGKEKSTNIYKVIKHK